MATKQINLSEDVYDAFRRATGAARQSPRQSSGFWLTRQQTGATGSERCRPRKLSNSNGSSLVPETLRVPTTT